MKEHEADGAPGLEYAAQVIVNIIVLQLTRNRSNLKKKDDI